MGTEHHGLSHTANLPRVLGMLCTSARALCVLQIPSVAWALNANQMLRWLLVVCCAMNRNCAKALPFKRIPNTKWTQTPGTPNSWAHCK